MILSQLYSKVSRALGRGTSQDANIPDWCAEALLFLEQNYTFPYMQKFANIAVDPSVEGAEFIDLPIDRLKRMEFVRFVQAPGPGATDPEPKPLIKVDAKDVLFTRHENPSAYFYSGDEFLVLDSLPDAAFTISMCWYEYTDFPVDSSAEPKLAKVGWNVLLNQTLMFAARTLRNAEMVSTYQVARDEALSALLRAYQERDSADTNLVMSYGRQR